MNKSAIIAGGILIVLLIGVFAAAPLLAQAAVVIDASHWQGNPIEPCFQHAALCAGHVLGSDENGRDVLARLVVGGRNTLEVALGAVVLELCIAAGIAALAKFRVAAPFANAIADGLSALPRLPLITVALAIFLLATNARSIPPVYLIAAFGITVWPRAFIALKTGATAFGGVKRGLSDLITVILLASAVDFLGWGWQPPAPSWGNMLANAETNFEIAWWEAAFPAACIFLTVLLVDVLRRGLPTAPQAAQAFNSRPSIRPNPSDDVARTATIGSHLR